MHTQNRYQGGYLEKTAAYILGIPEFDAEVFKTQIKIEIRVDEACCSDSVDGHTEEGSYYEVVQRIPATIRTLKSKAA